MIVTIHQPEHLPWLGFLDKVSRADRYILLDHVQYRKNYFQNRNRIRAPEGFAWLTVPVCIEGRHHQSIREVEIDPHGNPGWRQQCLGQMIRCYRKAPYFDRYIPFFEGLYRRHWKRLVDLNEEILRFLLDSFAVATPWVRSSALSVHGKKSDLNLEICLKMGAAVYLSGPSGRDYLELPKFGQHGVEVRFQEFRHPVYRQLFEPFLPDMSSLDLLFNHGPHGGRILRGETAPLLQGVSS